MYSKIKLVTYDYIIIMILLDVIIRLYQNNLMHFIHCAPTFSIFCDFSCIFNIFMHFPHFSLLSHFDSSKSRVLVLVSWCSGVWIRRFSKVAVSFWATQKQSQIEVFPLRRSWLGNGGNQFRAQAVRSRLQLRRRREWSKAMAVRVFARRCGQDTETRCFHLT